MPEPTGATPTIRVLVVDDHRIVAEGIALALRRQPGIEVVRTVDSGGAAVEAVAQGIADLVLMDYQLAGGTGVAAVEEIRRRFPTTIVVMISGGMDDRALIAALQAGASGYISKVSGGEEIARDLRRAAAGEMLVSAGQLRLLLRTRHADGHGETLTAREREVLGLLTRGLDNEAIAAELTISYHTVRGHVQAVLQKLEARSRLEAVARARDRGLLDL